MFLPFPKFPFQDFSSFLWPKGPQLRKICLCVKNLAWLEIELDLGNSLISICKSLKFYVC